MADKNTIGLTATLAVGDGSGGAGSASGILLDLTNIGPNDPEVQFSESKRLNLPGGLIGKVAALKDGGELPFQYEFSKGKKARLDALVGSERTYTVTLPDAGDGVYTKSGLGVLKMNKMDTVTPGEIVTVSASIMITGPWA